MICVAPLSSLSPSPYFASPSSSCCCCCRTRLCAQVSVAKQTLSDDRRHFDVVVACEDEEQEDLDVPLVSIRYK